VVVFSPRVPTYPQPYDVNCNDNVVDEVCGAGNNLTIHAQGIVVSLIPLADGTTAYVWMGERWLSAPNNNPNCPDECNSGTGDCQEPADYIKAGRSAHPCRRAKGAVCVSLSLCSVSWGLRPVVTASATL
jgi:hypothetical protein